MSFIELEQSIETSSTGKSESPKFLPDLPFDKIGPWMIKALLFESILDISSIYECYQILVDVLLNEESIPHIYFQI